MTDKDKIRNIIELFIAWNGETEPIDVANIDSAVEFIGSSLQEEPVSEDLEEASRNYADNEEYGDDVYFAIKAAFKEGAKWQKEHLWKLADGDNLPQIDREVIVLTQSYPLEGNEYAVSFAHRPNPNGWDGKSITTGNVEHYTPKTYDKGGWNIPNVKYWFDNELPKE